MGGLTLRGDGVKARALRAAFPRTVPILAGFLFLGMAYGVYMHVLGFSFWYPVVMAVVIFGGSLEFVAGTLLLSPFAPVQAFFITLMIQARHQSRRRSDELRHCGTRLRDDGDVRRHLPGAIPT